MPGTFQLRLLITLTAFIFYAGLTHAQTIQGRVYEMGTRNAITQAAVSIQSKPGIVYSDRNGNFEIKAAVNDLLVISATGYRPDTILLTDLKFKEIHLLQTERWLQEVKINANNEADIGSFKVYDPDFHNQTVTKQMDDNGNYKGGMTIRFWASKKEEKKRKKIEQLVNDQETAATIDKVFTGATIQKYIPVSDDEVTGFIDRYKPSLAVYRASSFNLLLYLNSAYKEFVKLPKGDRVRFRIFD